jgi:hypothetical protein
LRANKGKYWDGRNEVNMSPSVNYTKWGIFKYSGSLEAQMDDYLKAGHIFRIYHKEKDGYLMLKEDSSEVTICDASNLQYNEPSTIWQIERSDPSIGGLISYTDDYKIRNVSTGKYLATDYHYKSNIRVQEVKEDLEEVIDMKITVEQDDEKIEVTGEDSPEPEPDNMLPEPVDSNDSLLVYCTEEERGEGETVWYLSAPNFVIFFFLN